MRTVDPQRYQQRRLLIVDAAVTLFAAKGLARTTVAEIAAAARMSTGNLFHYFSSKQAIFYALFDLDRDEWDEVFRRAQADPDPWAALLGVIDRLAEEAAHPVAQGLIVEIIAQAHRDPECARLVRLGDERMLAGVAALIVRLRDAGLADPGMAPQAAARWVLTTADGFHTRGYPEPDRDRAAELAGAKTVIARLLRYTGPGSPD